MPSDAEFTAKVPFTQDPEFIKLQRDLQLRQEQERKELEKQQTEQRIEFGRQPGVTRQQLDDNYKRQLQEREAQSKNHKAETDRYTRDYHDAKVLREEMREKEKRETLEPELVNLLKKLDERQQKEALALVDQQERDLRLTGRADPTIIRLQDNDQAERFKIERERYIDDYHRAARMKAEMEQARRETLEHGIDPDKPKLSR